ncbi:MAG: hypothetical protein LIQ31_13005, partial [Planctomycetes bacterium]|nr:hypothetical protein [Planctomycetota bacterium]
MADRIIVVTLVTVHKTIHLPAAAFFPPLYGGRDPVAGTCVGGIHMTFNSLFNDFMLLCVLLINGVIIRTYVKPFQRWFLPAAFIGGIAGLFLGQQFIGVIEIPASFSGFNGMLMRIIMACSVLGVDVD